MNSAEISVDRLRSDFPAPPDDGRIMMRWWWFGPAVVEAELEAEIRAMKDAGIGGFEVAFVYPLLDDGDHGLKNEPFLSPPFLEKITFVSRKAKELGLRMDITIGSGWSYGGPHITPSLAARTRRHDALEVAPTVDFLDLPTPYQNETLIAAFAGTGSKQEMPEDFQQLDLTGNRIAIPPSQGPRVVLFYYSSPTGQNVKRAAVGAEGYVLDHYNPAATKQHLREVGDKLLDAAVPGSVHAIFCDSLEVYHGDWTDGILDVFRKRRGYDLAPLMPLLDYGRGETADRVRCDFGRTLTELYEENFMTPMREWAEQRGVLFRIQNYGQPPAALASHRHAHLIEGESWGWPGLPQTKWASSAARLLDKPVVSAETWTWVHSPSFRATPLDMKGEADQHFLLGINQLIGHGWPYSPPEFGKPGWMLYAAGALSDKNPWWPVMPDLSAYLHRVSHVLRQGEAVARVALYAPTEDAYASFGWTNDPHAYLNLWKSIERAIDPAIFQEINRSGNDFDLIDDGLLEEASERAYGIILMPDVRLVPDKTRAWLKAFVEKGGVVLSVGAKETVDLPFARSVPVAHLADTIREILGADLDLSPTVDAVGFVHRRLDDADIYFVANTGNETARVTARMRSTWNLVELWDPVTGDVEKVDASDGAIALSLEPYGSRILVACGESSATIGTPSTRQVSSRSLQDEWFVSFDGSPPTAVRLPHLWDRTDAWRFFSGTATYRRTIDIAGVGNGKRIFLEFSDAAPGEVGANNGFDQLRGKAYAARSASPIREAATIFVGKQRVGTLWKPPYRIELTQHLRPGPNDLTIEVYNTAINTLAEGGKLPDMARLRAHYGQRARLQDFDGLEPLPSGIASVPVLVEEQ